jgi:hypothetical protein
MAVDNCELPKDASEGFGSMFMVRYSMLFWEDKGCLG